jgi:hypothetical protein
MPTVAINGQSMRAPERSAMPTTSSARNSGDV